MEEYKVKALFLYNFAKFVDWPNSTFLSAVDPLSFCVIGTDPFGSALDDALGQHTIGGRPLTVRRISDPRQANTCRILFISSTERKHQLHILDSVRSCAVLTVGENEDFTSAGGVIRFVLETGRLRFEINQEAASAQHLKISAKLLNLAKSVKK
jgi:hypothetical protein